MAKTQPRGGQILDGSLTNADLSPTAAIEHSKLADAADGGYIMMGNINKVMEAIPLSGDIVCSGSGITAITNYAVHNSMVDPNAAIAFSKLAPLDDGYIIVGDVENYAQKQAVSGDVSLARTGAMTISGLAGSKVTPAFGTQNISLTGYIDYDGISEPALSAAGDARIYATASGVLMKSENGGAYAAIGGAAGANLPVWVEITVGHGDFTAAATTEDIELYSLLAGYVLHEVIISHSTAFNGTSWTACTLSVGIAGTLDRYASAFDVFQATGAQVGQQSTGSFFENKTSATSIRVAATSTDGNLNVSTAGVCVISLLVSKALT